jgi:hypothetical protein
VDDHASAQREAGASGGVAVRLAVVACIDDPGRGDGAFGVGLPAGIAARVVSAIRSRDRAVRRAGPRSGCTLTARTGTAAGSRGGFEPS